MISVIVPYKNAEQTLERCCESLTRQDGDFQFVMVNDWSEDGGQDIVSKYVRGDDPRFMSLYNHHNPGVSGARNTGIDYAAGDWITFLDADDMFTDHADKVLQSVTKLSANVIQFNHWRKSRKTGQNRLSQRYKNYDGIYDLENLPKGWCFVWNKLYRAGFLKGIRFVEGLQYGEDELFVLECLAKQNRIVHREGSFMIHTFDGDHKLSRNKTAEDLLDQVHGLEDFIMSHDDPVVRTAACKVLAEHWGSPSFLKIIGLTE